MNLIMEQVEFFVIFSIVMTTLSTVFALGTMPLWLFVFPIIIRIQSNCLRVPFDALGMYISLCANVRLILEFSEFSLHSFKMDYYLLHYSLA